MNPSTVDKLMSETRDVLASREVSELLSSCCGKARLTCVLDKLTESVTALAEETNNSDFVHPNCLTVFVAKMVPVLNNFIYQDAWPVQLLAIEGLRLFGANIYESFSC